MNDPLQALASILENSFGLRLEACRGERLGAHARQIASQHGLADLRELVMAVRGSGVRKQQLLDALLRGLLVHETFFYRYRAQLQVLEQQVLPSLVASNPAVLRLWSAGCSRGPEAYTLAMLALQASERAGGSTRVEVLATDVCEAFLAEARVGSYARSSVDDLPDGLRDRYLERDAGGRFRVVEQLRKVVAFQRHNLIEEPPRRGFDVVMCRNVLMYLRPDARDRAVEHLAAALARWGVLLLGHGDRVHDHGVLQSWGSVSMVRLAPGRARGGAGARERSAVPRSGGGEQGETPREAAESQRGRATVARVVLEGLYDGEGASSRLEALRGTLARLVSSGATIEVMADGAESLDGETARLLLRASRVAASQGGGLRVQASRESVVRWARRHGLAVEPSSGDRAMEGIATKRRGT